MPVPVLPHVLADGTLALGSEVRANDDAIVSVLDHGLDRDNFPSSGADIPATVLSTTAGERVPLNRMEDNAVDSRVLKSDATAGSPGAAVGTANHIKDGIITPGKLTTPAPGGGIGSDRLRIVRFTTDISALSGGTIAAEGTATVSFSTIDSRSVSTVRILNAGLSMRGLVFNPAIVYLTCTVIEYPSASGANPLHVSINNNSNSTGVNLANMDLVVTYIVIASS